jgi:glycosyltransferase involved in cell wall biosynthesis
VLVSVLLPARNASATLREALRSIAEEQRDAPPLEIVCVDDASTDATPQILREHKVKIVRGDGAGLVQALNKGLAQCTGELIARMDADDLAHPDRLRLQIEQLQKEPKTGAIGSLIECFPPSGGLQRLEGWLNSIVTPKQCHDARFIEAPLVHPSMTFRREAIQPYEDHGWAEDWDLQLRLIEQGWELSKVPQKLLRWRDSEARLTRTGAAYASEQMFKLRAHYLSRGPLANRPFDIWGAGPTGKRLARELEAHARFPRAFYDIDESKKIARGKPVLHERDLPRASDALMLCAVGVPSARDEIRAMFEKRDYIEGQQFLFAA